MSWEGILQSLAQSDCVQQAALAGRDGMLWSATPGFAPTQQEILSLIGYCDGEATTPSSFTLCGRRYLTLRKLEGCIDGKFCQDVVTIALTLNCVVIGAHVANATTNATTMMSSVAPGCVQQQVQQPFGGIVRSQGLSERVHLAVTNIKQYLQRNGY